MPFCELYERGFSIKRKSLCVSKKGGGKRGRISGEYSSSSFRRLREFVITHDAPGALWGITFTVPGLDNFSCEEFKKLAHRFFVWCNVKRFPLVWRVELQRRGMPHLHCVLYGSDRDALSCAVEWFRLLKRYSVWTIERVSCNDVELVYLPRAFVSGASHAFNVCSLENGFSAFRYLVAHMSKGKREQLGFIGRNWGVVHRIAFHKVKCDLVQLSESQYFKILRWVRRWTRRNVCAKFGCSWWVSDPGVLRGMCDFAVELERILGVVVNDVRDSGKRPSYWLYSWFGLQFLASIPDFFADYVVRRTAFDCMVVEKELFELMVKLQLYNDVPFKSER